MIKTYYSSSCDETEKIGRELACELVNRGTGALIRLYGEMGVGKTAFVRGFCSALGIGGVKSPTYTIVNEYRAAVPVYHFDMVRIESEDDLYSTGFWEYLEDERAFLLIEWTENIDELLTPDGIFVTISRVDTDEDARKIVVEQRCS